MSGQLFWHLTLWILVLLIFSVIALFACYGSDWCRSTQQSPPPIGEGLWVHQ